MTGGGQEKILLRLTSARCCGLQPPSSCTPSAACAARGVRKARQLNLTEEQKSQLREREQTEQAAAESAFLKLYAEVWLPRVEEGGLGIEQRQIASFGIKICPDLWCCVAADADCKGSTHQRF